MIFSIRAFMNPHETIVLFRLFNSNIVWHNDMSSMLPSSEGGIKPRPYGTNGISSLGWFSSKCKKESPFNPIGVFFPSYSILCKNTFLKLPLRKLTSPWCFKLGSWNGLLCWLMYVTDLPFWIWPCITTSDSFSPVLPKLDRPFERRVVSVTPDWHTPVSSNWIFLWLHE